MNPLKNSKLFFGTIILIIVYLAGVIGLNSSYRDYFLLLTPVNLILSTTILLLNHKEFNKAFVFFAVLTFLSGYFIELLGVRTGSIFGEYSYGNTLGIKLYNVPVIIGINWLMLIYCSGVIFNDLINNLILKSSAGALSLVILDFFIEPAAIKFNFWSWNNNTIPVQNYVAWFIVSFIFLLIFNLLQFNKSNKIARALFIIQLVFFVLLNL